MCNIIAILGNKAMGTNNIFTASNWEKNYSFERVADLQVL